MSQSGYTVTLDLADGTTVSHTIVATGFQDAKDRIVAMYPTAVRGDVEAPNGYTEFTL